MPAFDSCLRNLGMAVAWSLPKMACQLSCIFLCFRLRASSNLSFAQRASWPYKNQDVQAKNYTLPYHMVGSTQLCSGQCQLGPRILCWQEQCFPCWDSLTWNLDWSRMERLQPATGSALQKRRPLLGLRREHAAAGS